MTSEQPIYITKEGFDKLKKEYDELTTAKRREVAVRIRTAKELGDLSENAEYADAKEEQAFVEGKILELEHILKNAKVIEHKGDSDVVEIGSTIHVTTEGKKMTFTIVGHSEADPTKGLISNESPLGQAFIGRSAGDVVEVRVPRGVMQYTIDAIT